MGTQPRFEDYPFEIRPLAEDEGGGFLITFPDLPGCMSDGETPIEAIENGRDAFAAWMAVHVDEGRPIPAPGSGGDSGRFVARVPKTLHARLAAHARQEGMSMNTLVATFIAEGMGRREGGTGQGPV